MSKHRKKDSLESRNPAKQDAGSPHIFRFISAFTHVSADRPDILSKLRHFLAYQKGRWRRNASFLLFTGLLLLGVINVFYQRTLPAAVTRLLDDPYDVRTLQELLRDSRNPGITGEIITILTRQGNEQQISGILEEKNKLYETINKVTLVMKNHPRYPDAYAYRAVLYFKLHECTLASRDIQGALVLDPNRKIFQKLSQGIAQCN